MAVWRSRDGRQIFENEFVETVKGGILLLLFVGILAVLSKFMPLWFAW